MPFLPQVFRFNGKARLLFLVLLLFSFPIIVRLYGIIGLIESSLIVFSGMLGPLGWVVIWDLGFPPGIRPEMAFIAFSPAFLKKSRISLALRCCADAIKR